MLFKKKKIMTIPEGATLNALRYTYDTMRKFYPSYPQEKWEAETCPMDVREYVNNVWEKYDAPVRVITITDEYWDWAKENNVEPTMENIPTYAANISDEDATRLLKDYSMDKAHKQMCLYLMISKIENYFGNETEWGLSEQTKEKILLYLEPIFGKENVCIPGYVVNTDELYAKQDILDSITSAWFEEGKKVIYGKWNTQTQSPEANLAMAVIPFTIRCPVESAVFEDQEQFDFAGSMSTKGKEWENAVEAIQKDFGDNYDVSVTPLLLEIRDLPDVEKTVYKQIRKMLGRKHMIPR